MGLRVLVGLGEGAGGAGAGVPAGPARSGVLSAGGPGAFEFPPGFTVGAAAGGGGGAGVEAGGIDVGDIRAAGVAAGAGVPVGFAPGVAVGSSVAVPVGVAVAVGVEVGAGVAVFAGVGVIVGAGAASVAEGAGAVREGVDVGDICAADLLPGFVAPNASITSVARMNAGTVRSVLIAIPFVCVSAALPWVP